MKKILVTMIFSIIIILISLTCKKSTQPVLIIPGPQILMKIDTLRGHPDTSVDAITMATKIQNRFLVTVDSATYQGDSVTMAALDYGDSSVVDTLTPGVNGFQIGKSFPLYHWWNKSGLLTVRFQAFTLLGGRSDTSRVANVLLGRGKRGRVTFTP
jgi:hypothetical protein